MPEPITQYVLKVHSRCDLACDHCYVYEHADQSWRVKPLGISPSIAAQAAQRIAEHAAAHQLPQVRLILHGGEPLLLGLTQMRAVLAALTSRIAAASRADIRIHTNGVQLDERWCDLFDEYAVKVGVSLDGDRVANDRHRRYSHGRSSYDHVLRALALLRLPRYRHLYAGILCTIDLANDPIAVYEALMAQEPPNLDLLLPHASWENPPYRPAGAAAPYAAWLAAVYRRWVADGQPAPIRLFDSLISAARGGPSWSEAVGLDPVDLLVVETDGSWEQPDSLKTAYHGATATGLNVTSDRVDDVATLPGFVARQGGLASLSPDCQACPVAAICGGGLYAHRYRATSGFNNPSVYCADLKTFIGQVTADLPEPPSAATPRHELTSRVLDALAAGPGDVAAIEALAQERLVRTRALVAEVAWLNAGWGSAELRTAAAEGWTLLCALDGEHPAAVREIFAHPLTYAWAIRCLRPPRHADTDLDRAHLAGLAAAAALRAGVSARLPVPVREGALHLPTVGALQIEPGAGRTAMVSVTAGRPAIGGGRLARPTTTGRATWQAARRVSGPTIRVALEDLDPFRAGQGWPVTGRLTTPQWRTWRLGLQAAGRRLATALPRYAEVLTAGLRSVIPLRAATNDPSGTARPAFGTVALASPAGRHTMDGLLLQEFQRSKLYAITDMQDLFDPASTRRLPVPWGGDPEPVEKVLHGAYAHLARAHLARSQGPQARGDFVRYQSWVRETTAGLSASGALTTYGERFVVAMRIATHAPADAG